MKTANDASDKFAAFQKTSADMYQTMLANQQKLEQAFEQDFQRESSLHAEALAAAVPGYTWPQIRNQLEDFNRHETALRAEFLTSLNRILLEDRVISTEQQDLKAATVDLDNAIGDAVDRQNDLQVSKALFTEALKAATSTSSGGNVASSLKSAATNILGTSVTLTTYQKGKFGTKTSTIGDQLRSQLPQVKNGNLISVLKEDTVSQFDPASQPGLSVVILSVARTFVQSEVDRLQLRLQYLADVRGIISDALEDQPEEPLANTILTLDRVASHVQSKTTVLDTINKCVKSGDDVSNPIQVVAVYLIDYTVVFDDLQLAQERLARRAHMYSIEASSIDAKERETLIGLGIQGLVTYQQNGITPDEIANLIRAAQTVALSFIAAGVF